MKKSTINQILSNTVNFDQMINESIIEGMGALPSYAYKAHNSQSINGTNIQDVAGFESFCEVIYRDWYETVKKNYNLNTNYSAFADAVLSDPKLNPNEIAKSVSDGVKTPFYNIIWKEYSNKLKGFSLEDFRVRFAKTQKNNDALDATTQDGGDFFYVNGDCYARKTIDSRLYINFKAKNIPTFCKLFFERSRAEDLHPEFKFLLQDVRNDNFLLYCSKDMVDKYVGIIDTIKKEHPNLFEGCENTKPFTASINGYIGFGSEPVNFKSKESFTSVRQKSVKNTINALKVATTEKYPSKIILQDIPEIAKLRQLYVQQALKHCKNIIVDKDTEKRIREKADTKFIQNISDFIYKGLPLPDEIVFDGKVVPINTENTDWLEEIYKISNDKQCNSRSEYRASLIRKQVFSSETSFTQEEKVLLNSVHKNLVFFTKQSLSSLSSETNLKEREYYEKLLLLLDKPVKDLDPKAKSIVIIGAGNFIKNKTVVVNFKGSTIYYPECSLPIYKDVLGEKTVEDILRSECEKFDISFDNVALSESYRKKLQEEMSTTSENKSEQTSEKQSTIESLSDGLSSNKYIGCMSLKNAKTLDEVASIQAQYELSLNQITEFMPDEVARIMKTLKGYTNLNTEEIISIMQLKGSSFEQFNDLSKQDILSDYCGISVSEANNIITRVDEERSNQNNKFQKKLSEMMLGIVEIAASSKILAEGEGENDRFNNFIASIKD